jgi:hypothetical protein
MGRSDQKKTGYSNFIASMKKAIYIFLFISLLPVRPIFAKISPAAPALSDKTTVSLLTVYPKDKAVYAIFGHTALRICDPEQNIDLVYNYGFFDSTKPNFIYHFVKGETDYILGVQSFEEFLFAYACHETAVDEQTLNLTREEKTSVFQFLNNNALPENREYRYNYFFDNCTTRPRDIVENSLRGKLVYREQSNREPVSLRDMVYKCTYHYSWLALGIDLVLGSGTDSLIHPRQELFLPVKLKMAFDSAYIATDSTSYPLVTASRTLLDSDDRKQSFVFLPEYRNPDRHLHFLHVFLGLLIIVVLSIIPAGKYTPGGILFRSVDFLLFFAAGTAGCIVAFIAFCSTHPCTSDNWNILWLHPLHLAAAVLFMLKKAHSFRYWYHLINFAALTLFLAVVWIWKPQYFPVTVSPAVLCLMARSVVWIRAERSSSRKTDK